MAVTVGSLLDDEHWHSVHVERFNRQVNLSVDAHTQHFHTGGEGHSLEVDYEVSPRGGGGWSRHVPDTATVSLGGARKPWGGAVLSDDISTSCFCSLGGAKDGERCLLV